MRIPSFPSTRSLENIHVDINAQLLVVVAASLVLLVLFRAVSSIPRWLRLSSKSSLQVSSRDNEKASSGSEKQSREPSAKGFKSWRWSSGFGFGLELESFPIALNSTHKLGWTPPVLGSGAGVLNSKLFAAMPTENSPTAGHSQPAHLIQPKLAKNWFKQHGKNLRVQTESASAASRRTQNAFETPLPAVYQSVKPVSMAKMIMSRHVDLSSSNRGLASPYTAIAIF
ncbi:hypothetical protein PC9H_000475 [Pleurotus ostreatus]|uniref:Uncharacterized protein n=1 Tax=Pleurotus ostreatus TaxID=5322 RepID=A0A8H7A555_PLEOS|nr:uncharacterized protein PC9H_000475 [Pleurotus ostreatus]KAF7440131.1 hypothetical protein PC9H_000475 [Pleurotus ostreatus]